MIELEHLRTVPLSHDGECGLLGVGPDLSFYAEEIYGEEGWMAQAAYDLEGRRLDAVDEASGDNMGAERLSKPGNLVRPTTGMSTIRLNFGGARHRGLLDEDRVEEVVRPLAVPDRLLLVEEGLLAGVQPAEVLGLAQSYVTSEVQIVPSERAGRERRPLFLLSRRLRVAYRLREPTVDNNGAPYDYDSQEVAVLQHYTPGEEDAPLGETILSSAELGVTLNWPTDIVLRDDLLFAADAARQRDGLSSQVHIWRITIS